LVAGLPDMERGVEEQEVEIRELEVRIREQRRVLEGLKAMGGGVDGGGKMET
jgi:RNA polymerase II transcription mediator complex subunit 9